MNTKSFVTLVIAILVLGGSLGGAFVGGIALGKNQEDDVALNSASTQLPSGTDQQASGQLTQEQLDQFRQQIQSGEFDPENRDQLRQQFQDQFGQGGPDGLGFGGAGGLTGTIEGIEGDTITINTAQGPLLATIGADTTIQIFVEGTLTDLENGIQVTVRGQRGEDGTVEATSITVTPEGLGGLFGGPLFEGQRRPNLQLP